MIWYAVSSLCENTGVVRNTAGTSVGIPAALDTEHPVDVGLALFSSHMLRSRAIKLMLSLCTSCKS